MKTVKHTSRRVRAAQRGDPVPIHTIILVIIGVYPEAFPLSERIGKKKQPEKAVNGNRPN